MVQYLRQINITELKYEKDSAYSEILNTKPGRCSLEAFHKLARSLQWHRMYISYTVTQSFHTRSSVWPHTQSAGGEKKFVDSPLSLSLRRPWEFDFCPASVFLLSRLWGLFISPRCKGSHFSLSQPLLPIQHAHTHADFHFSYSARLAAPPPQGWLKTGG